MKKRKLFIGLFCFLVIAALNFTALLKPAKAVKEPVSCYGYHWIHCLSGDYVIRCDCDGGPICYAAWQGFCP